MCSGLVVGLTFMARAALLACVGGLAFFMRECLWWFPALVLLADAFLTITSLCNDCEWHIHRIKQVC